MRRGAKPSKAEREAKLPAVGKSPRREDSAVRQLERRLAEALERETELLRRETEVQDQQRATAEILDAISRSPADLQPVLDAVARSASRLCGAANISLYRIEGSLMRKVAEQGPPLTTLRVGETRPITRASVSGRAIVDGTTIHVPEVQSAAAAHEYPEARRDTGIQTTIGVPLLREGVAIGAFTAYRTESRPFSEREIALLRTFAAQAVIAIENGRLLKETKEALDQQTATSEILGVISRSPTDVQPVFDAVVTSTARLCEAHDVALLVVEGDELRPTAGAGPLYRSIPPDFRLRLTRGSVATRAVVDRTTIHIRDLTAEPDDEYPVGRELARRFGHRTMLAVPLFREGVPIGVICAFRLDVQPFPEQQIALLKTFADQAVIAIENVRLFTELRARNRELGAALEQQTATAEILRVISRSPTDVQPVFTAIADSAARLCDALDAIVLRVDGDVLRLVAHHGPMPAGDVPLHPGTLGGRTVLEHRLFHIEDLQAEGDTFPEGSAIARQRGHRTTLSVPLLRDGVAIGNIQLRRNEVRRFSDQQIALLHTFADQAVIAIANVRLFNELDARNRDLTEALDRQTATADILRAISQAQTDVQPVFEAIADSAMRLLGAWAAAVTRYEGGLVSLAAARGGLPGSADAVRERLQAPHRPVSPPEACLLTKRVHHVGDVETDPSCTSEFRRHAASRGLRSFVAVPMLRGGDPLGMIVVSRAEPGGFSATEITLLQTFADQAVIAVENARLLTELQARTAELTTSVGQLTALGEVGQAVASSLNLETVLTTIVSRAVQLTGLNGGVVFEYDEAAQQFEQRAASEQASALAEARRAAPIRMGEGVVGRTAVTLEPAQVPDITVAGAYEGRLRESLVASGVRAVLAVPMVREGGLIGCLAVTRNAPGEFPPATIELLRTFAGQSTLAIQNARLFREIEQKSRQLEAASRHKSEFLANMSHELRTPLNAIIGFSEVLTERMFGELNDKQEEYLKDIHASGQHLLSLINDILDLSKVEAGRMELELKDFDLSQAVGNAVTLVRERAARRGISLHQAMDGGVGRIRGDERKIRQVVLNLLSNALKFTPEGGRVDVRATVGDGMAEVSVTDTGVGIAPEDQEAVFEEFRQVGTADRKVEGTGLGLALSRKFIELHGGTIRVRSQLGSGSTFTFAVPLVGPQDPGGVTPAPATP